MKAFLFSILGALSVNAASTTRAASALPPAGTFTPITDFGANPTNIGMFAYIPPNISTSSPPALIMALHYCHGTADAYFAGTNYKALADARKSFVLLFGNAPASDGCWDVSSPDTLKHDAGGDSLGVASAVRYAINNWGVDSERVFVTGTSSGAMMTNVMAGSYPDLFQAGVAFSGVPFSCFAEANPGETWSTACATGQITKSASEWGDAVRAAYPSYTGSYPRLELWHGTADDVLNYTNFGEEIKEWTNVWQIPQTPTSTQPDTPLANYTKTTYGDGQIVAFSAAGVGHNIPVSEETFEMVLNFFAL